jgi:hypothetical protein
MRIECAAATFVAASEFGPGTGLAAALSPDEISGVSKVAASSVASVNSAGIESALKEVIGEVKAIPLFTSVSGPGNNAAYVISRFVGIRIMGVRLTGNPSKRHVTVQPAPFSDATVIKGQTEIRSDSIFTTPVLIR